MEISINARQITYSFAAFGSRKAQENGFGEFLNEETPLPPDKWVTEAGFSADAVKAAAEFMRTELGIDTSKIEPTHEITSEQMDWLRSRHDFSTMRHTEMYSFKNDGGQTQYGFKATPEYSNFLGDLMYLGVYTEQELTVGLWVEPVDTRPDSYGGVISTHLSDYIGGSPFDFSRALVSNLENMWNFYNERSKGAFAVNGDAEFADLIKENLSLQKQFFEFLNELFENNATSSMTSNYLSANSVDKSSELAEIIGAKNVPTRWTSESLYKTDLDTLEGYRVNRSAVQKVREQLKSEGIDPDRRTPAHELTDEQEEWLRSRYDVDFLNACSFEHPDFGNFMLDLAYLNVFSLDEVENMYGVLPFNASHKAYIYRDGDYSGGGESGYLDTVNGTPRLLDDKELIADIIMEYIRAKYTGLSDKEYEKMAEEMQTQRETRLSALSGILARLSGNSEQTHNYGGVKPVIKNISYKLKEDFGGIM